MTLPLKNLRKFFSTQWNSIVAVNLPNDGDVRLGRLFNVLMVISTGIVSLLILVFLLMIPLKLTAPFVAYLAASFPFVVIPLSVYCVIQTKRGNIRSSVALYVWFHMIAISCAVFIFDGILSPGWILYIWTITIAGILLTPIYSLWMTCGVVAYFFSLFSLTHFGVYNPPLTFGMGREFAETAFLLIMLVSTVGLLTFLNMQSLQDALKHLHDEIAERKQTELALQFSEEKYRTVSDFTYDWEYWLSTNGKYIYVSPSCERVTGYTPEDFFKNSNLFLEIIHPDERSYFANHLHEVLQKDCGVRSLDFRIITRSGQERWISHDCQSVFDSNGNWLGRRGSNRDTTERKLAEEKIQKINEELKELNATKDKFFSIIAHDLKSPFQGLMGYSQILSNEYSTLTEEEKTFFINSIYELSKNTFVLLENLLIWSRIQTGKFVYNPDVFNLHQELTPTIKLLTQVAKNKNIAADCLIDKKILVKADCNMLQTVVRNLISNAIKFTNPGGRIIISTKSFEDFVEISVEDNGIGIKKENLENLFKTGKNFSTKGTADEEGTGLGLILCAEMIRINCGKIWAESEIGKGTKFIFRIPSAV